MYDRKTWIILAICGVLIALNMHYSAKNAEYKRANQPPAEAPADSFLAEAGNAETPQGGLVVETPPPPTSEETIVLENDNVAFTLSNIGGGIKYADLKNYANVAETSRVRINKYSPGPIGGLVGSGNTLDNSSYSYSAEKSEAGKTAVFIAKLSTGIIAKKTFSLETTKVPGEDYFLNLTLELENTTTANYDLSQYSIFLGSAAPLHPRDERAELSVFSGIKVARCIFKTQAFKDWIF